MLATRGLDFVSVYRRYDLELEDSDRPECVASNMLPDDPIMRNVAMAVTYIRFKDVVPAVIRALQFRMDPMVIIDDGLVRGMNVVSYLYSKRAYCLPEVIMASKIMELGISMAEKAMNKERRTKGKIVMHVAEGDPHDIGKNIAASLLRASGYKVIDLGKDVNPEVVVDAIVRERPIMVTGTALMTVTLGSFLKVVAALIERGIEIPYMVAGGAVNRDFAESFEMGIYSRKAPQTIPIADMVANGHSWKEVRETWDDIVREC